VAAVACIALFAGTAAQAAFGKVPGERYKGHVALRPSGHAALRFRAYPHHLSHFHSTAIPLRCNRGSATARLRPIEAIHFDSSGRFAVHYELVQLEPGNGTPLRTDRFTLRGGLTENKAHGIFRYSFHKRSGKNCHSGKLRWTARRR
jgi:hypothetical protein